MDRRKRNCYGVPTSISRFNPSRLLPLVNFKEHSVRHKTTNTGGTEKSDWTYHQRHSVSNNPGGMSLCSTSSLGMSSAHSPTFPSNLQYVTTHSPTLPSLYLRHSSFSNFRYFTYVTAHSPTLLSLLIRHRLFTYVTWRAAHNYTYHLENYPRFVVELFSNRKYKKKLYRCVPWKS